MLFQIHFPTIQELETLKKQQSNMPFSYPQIQGKIKGYTYDNHSILLGEGKAVFEAAKIAIQQWAMFPNTWARIYTTSTPLNVGETVIMYAHIMGLWWLNVARIVYTVSEKSRFGFAYGTLKHHAESGEELFQVRIDEKNHVFYEIKAFSKPRHWLARLAFPIARYYQLSFVKNSQQHFKKMTHAILSHSQTVF